MFLLANENISRTVVVFVRQQGNDMSSDSEIRQRPLPISE